MNSPTSNEEALHLLKQAMPNAEITVNGDGYKYEAIVICDSFKGLNTLQRHKQVYAALNSVIASGSLHALTIKALTTSENAANQSSTSY